MAYNTPPTKSIGNTFTASEWNTYMRDNQAAMAPDVFAAKGDLFAASAANAGQVLTAGADYTIIEAMATEAVGMRWTQFPVGAQISRATAQSIGNNSDTQITGLSTTDFVKGVTIGSDTIDIPAALAGIYIAVAYGYWDSAATGGKLRQVGVKVGLNTIFQSTVSDADTQNIQQTCTRVFYVSSAVSVSMQALQISGGSLNLNATRLSVFRLR